MTEPLIQLACERLKTRRGRVSAQVGDFVELSS
jgi:uncharacterized protein